MKAFRIMLADDLHQAAKIKAAQQKVSMASICRQALREWTAEDKPPATSQEEKPTNTQQGRE